MSFLYFFCRIKLRNQIEYKKKILPGKRDTKTSRIVGKMEKNR